MKTRLITIVSLPAFVLGANAADWKPVPGHMMTRWAKDVDPVKPHPEHLRQRVDGIIDRILAAQRTEYPWDGKARVTVDPAQASEFSLNLRTAIPYYAWQNRSKGAMTVWIQETTHP